ncbi:MAG: nuclear transport factor 2 family protein [Cyclobacteriaceae bacterium]
MCSNKAKDRHPKKGRLTRKFMCSTMMKIRKKNYLLLGILFVLLSAEAYGQAPSGHAEVWQNVEKYWNLWAERDLDGFLDYHHIAYTGWDYNDAMHKNKKTTKEWGEHEFKTREIIAFTISAIDIKIHNNTAIAHYYYSIIEKNAKGSEERRSGRKTDVLMKQTNKWVMTADHGGDIK